MRGRNSTDAQVEKCTMSNWYGACGRRSIQWDCLHYPGLLHNLSFFYTRIPIYTPRMFVYGTVQGLRTVCIVLAVRFSSPAGNQVRELYEPPTTGSLLMVLESCWHCTAYTHSLTALPTASVLGMECTRACHLEYWIVLQRHLNTRGMSIHSRTIPDDVTDL